MICPGRGDSGAAERRKAEPVGASARGACARCRRVVPVGGRGGGCRLRELAAEAVEAVNAIEGGFSQMNKFLEDDLTLAERDPERAIHEALLRVDMRYGTAFTRRSREDVRKWL